MFFHDLPINKWKRYPVKLSWGEMNPKQERYFFTYNDQIYKLWSTEFDIKNLFISDGKWSQWNYEGRPKSIAALDAGFIRNDIAPAFVDLIWKEDFCVGYVMKLGNRVDKIPPQFSDKVLMHSLKIGYLHTDFCARNICEINGEYSLIDLDTPLTKISTLDYKFEASNGALRDHVDAKYRSGIIKSLDIRHKPIFYWENLKKFAKNLKKFAKGKI